ncbi:hypothetical protein ACL58G_04585 [Massilia sp. GER05]|uniref:hypothetical protein n=1 Tax=Massilia sp. GER05 TaxID=3394605 RepID=UPI003F864FC4
MTAIDGQDSSFEVGTAKQTLAQFVDQAASQPTDHVPVFGNSYGQSTAHVYDGDIKYITYP